MEALAVTPLESPDRSQRLADQITELSAYISAATCQLLELIAEFDEGRHWEKLGLHSCAHWLNFQCGIGMNAAREKVRVATALKELPLIREAFRKGELSYSKVRAMTRVAHTHNEDYLMSIARHGSAYHVEKLVAIYRRCKRHEDVANAQQQFEQRKLSYFYDDDGSLVLRGRFPAETGAMIVKAIERAMDEENSEADAAADSVVPNTADDVAAETTEKLPIAARRADAFAGIGESYLNEGPRSTSTADRYLVVVHVSAETLKDEPDVSAETSEHINADLSHIDDGPHVSAETSRRMACDCSIVGLVEDDEGEPLSIGRKSRVIPPAMRRALRFRDKGCRFPGCTHQHFIDGHHIQHWADGGETSLDNLVQLCRFHHHLVHEEGFDCQRLSDGAVVFKAPDQRTLHESCAPLSLDEEADLARWMDRQLFELDIDADTCKPQWYAGDRMDWHLGVHHLFAADSRRPTAVVAAT